VTRSKWVVGLAAVVVVVWCMCSGAFVQGSPFLPCIRAKTERRKVAAGTSASSSFRTATGYFQLLRYTSANTIQLQTMR
jgi:hypothetical protein